MSRHLSLFRREARPGELPGAVLWYLIAAAVSVSLLAMHGTDIRFAFTAAMVAIGEAGLLATWLYGTSRPERQHQRNAPMQLALGLFSWLGLLAVAGVVVEFLRDLAPEVILATSATASVLLLIASALVLNVSTRATRMDDADDGRGRFMLSVRSTLENLANEVTTMAGADRDVVSRVKKLSEQARYASPQSLPAAQPVEIEIGSLTEKLAAAVRAGKRDDALACIDRFDLCLKRREVDTRGAVSSR